MALDPRADEAAVEERLRRAQEAAQRKRLHDRYQAAERDHAIKQEKLIDNPVFKAAQAAKVALEVASPEGVARRLVGQLMELMAKPADDPLAVKVLPTIVVKRGGCCRVAHLNVNAIYGFGGGPETFGAKLRNLMVLTKFCKVDLVVCTEVHSSAAAALEEMKRTTPGWDFALSPPLSPVASGLEECVAWLWNGDVVDSEGEPALVIADDWVRALRVRLRWNTSHSLACCLPTATRGSPTCGVQIQNKGGAEISALRVRLLRLLFSVCFSLSPCSSHTDPYTPHDEVAALGEYAAQLSETERHRCVFAGDFNLAPELDLKPSPKWTGAGNAFQKLFDAGFVASNRLATNLCFGQADKEGRVYDNFFVHADIHLVGLHLEMVQHRFQAGNQEVFVVNLDEMLLTLAKEEKVPADWLLTGLRGKTPADGEGAAAANAGRSHAHGMSSLGLFDHRFTFIDLSKLN